jgi:m7GpppX diphosphatase
MKWDLTNVASLYLVALMLLPNIKSLRDLNRSHIPLLRSIRREAANVVKSRWGLQATELRLFVHYQPSYCKLYPPFLPALKSHTCHPQITFTYTL